MLDLQKLRTFQVVAETSSFTRAAAELRYSQSSVTCHVQALESELGVTLLDRNSKRVTLTEAGRQVLQYASRLLALANEAREALHKQDGVGGSITVSAPEVLVAYRLPVLLRRFQEMFPQVQLTLLPHSNTNAQFEGLFDDTLDVAFAVGETVRSGRLTAQFLASEEIVLVVPPGHSMAEANELTAAGMAEEKILVTGDNCAFRQTFERALRAARFELKNTLELASIEAIKQCALAGMGLAVVPKMAVAAELLHRRLIALSWPGGSLRAQVQMIRRRKRAASAAAVALWSLAEDVFSRLETG